MCKGSNTTTSTSRPDDQAYGLYSQLLQRAQGVANQPFQPYGGEFVAPVNQQQNLGIANINAAQPVFGQALTMAQNAAQPITPEQIRQYENPYTQDVVQATQAQFANQNAQAQNALKGQAASQNALGGNRIGVAASQLANQQQLAQAPVIAGLIRQGYDQATATALAEQQAQAQGAYGVANIGQGQLGAAGAQIGAGSLQQGTQQALDTAKYNEFLQQQAYPFQTTQWLAGLGTGVGSQMGGTSTTTPPRPSAASQIMGGIGTGVGALGASGAFGSAGWLMPLMAGLNRGGGVSGYAEGGGVAGPETLPEGPDTLMAQQEALLSGDRKAQMFPNGTPELPLPGGMARTETPNGVFHHDPNQVQMDEIKALSGMGRENELLDLGPFSKEQIAQRVRQGEIPFAIVERNPAGVEVRAAVGTRSTLPLQLPVFEQKKAPGNTVAVEPLQQTLARRQASQGVANRDVGGSVNGQPPMAGTPYGGVKGWVPSVQITRGSGAPRTPGVPQQKSGSSLQDQMKNIVGLGKSIYQGMNSNSFGDPLTSSGDDVMGGAGLSASEDNPTPYHRGGTVGVAGYADGGMPYANVKSWVPDMQITGGHGAPPPPTPPQGKSDSSGGMGGIAGLAGAFSGIGKNSFGDRIIPDSMSSFGGAGMSASEENPSMFHRGGVADFADGGTPIGRDLPTYYDYLRDPEPEKPGFGSAPDFGPTMPTEGVAPPPVPLPRPRPPEAPTQVAALEPTTVSDATPMGVAAPDAPRGIRNNNPGNIEDGPFVQKLPGYAGSDGRFARFDTPEAGQKAAEVLLTSYGDKGVNTLSGIVSRWAPASDGNDTQAYVATLSKETGIPPDQPINLQDPQVRAVVAKAIFKHENGLGGGRANLPSARNAGLGPTQPGASVTGVASPAAAESGIDWSGNSKLWPSLMAAGLGMMASNSPFVGQAIGEGGLQGLATYQGLRGQEAQQKLSQARLDLEARKLGQQADIAEKNLKLHMMPYSGQMTTHEQKQLAIEAAKLEEARRQHDLSLRTPVKRVDAKGEEHMYFPTPSPDGKGIEWSELDPATNQLIPMGKSLPGAKPPGQQQPGPGVPQSEGKPGFQTAAFDPAKDGIWKVNQEQVQAGPVDYSRGAPYIEKGMDVPEPQDVAGRSPQALKTDAESYLQTGKLPPVRSGNSPVARQMNNYRNAVQNYGNALAQSRGMTPEQVADAWRTAPGTLRFILGADGRATVSLGTAVRHLDTLAEYAKAWNAGDQRTLNRVSAAISREFGGTAATNLETVAHIVGPEIVKAIGVAGAGTAEDREMMSRQFTTARSYPQVMGAVVATQKLMGGQLEGKERQAANAGVSPERFKSLIGERPYEILKSSEKGGNPLLKPSLEQFMTAAKKANPGMSDDQLKEIYKKKYQ